MSISAQPSAWKLQQIASSLPNRSIAHARTSCGSLSSSSTAASPASSSSMIRLSSGVSGSSLNWVPGAAMTKSLGRDSLGSGGGVGAGCVSTCDRNQLRVRRPHTKVRERLISLAPLQVCPEQPRHIVFDQRRWHSSNYRLAYSSVLAQPAAQDNVERLERLAGGPPTGRALKSDVAGPMLRTRVRASVEIQLEAADLLAELIHQPLDNRRELGLGGSDGVVAMRIADTSDRRRVQPVRLERKPNRADLRDNVAKLRRRNSADYKILPPREPNIAAERRR